jgi:hypothetical protein
MIAPVAASIFGCQHHPGSVCLCDEVGKLANARHNDLLIYSMDLDGFTWISKRGELHRRNKMFDL